MVVSPESARAKPAALNWQDPFLLEDQLSGEERLIRDSAAAYGRDKLTPRVIAANRGEIFDREILREMGALGFLGATLPVRVRRGRGELCFLWFNSAGD